MTAGVRTIVSQDLLIIPRPEKQRPRVEPKPRGLWYEVDGDWRRWCVAESFCLENARYLHRLDFDGERIFEINSATALDAFHERWAIPLWYSGSLHYPNWPAFSVEYDGIEIAPYLWARRFVKRVSTWYYSWDCASGCVWRPKGMRVELVGTLSLKDDADGR